jgi:hypothetical protein
MDRSEAICLYVGPTGSRVDERSTNGATLIGFDEIPSGANRTARADRDISAARRSSAVRLCRPTRHRCLLVLSRRNCGSLHRRARPQVARSHRSDTAQGRMCPGGRRPGTRLILAALVLDRRFHWSDTVPVWLKIIAVLLFADGCAALLWAMQANRFFSSVVRLQPDRGHRLVDDGPYGFVRESGRSRLNFPLSNSSSA